VYANQNSTDNSTDNSIVESIKGAESNASSISTIDPYDNLRPIDLATLRLFYNGLEDDFASLREHSNARSKLNVWLDTNVVIRDAMFALDNIVLLDILVKPESQDKFLDKYSDSLGTNFTQLYLELKEQRLNVYSDEVYDNYAVELMLGDDHLQSLKTGIISPDCDSHENVFGQTPYDYVLNQLLEFYMKDKYTFSKEGYSLAQLTKLDNLRESMFSVDRSNICTLTSIDNVDWTSVVEILARV
jgi:hypothetical protein